MNTYIRFVLVSFLICAMLSACGPSQAELDSTVTEVAENILLKQMAKAPTVTATLPPSPTTSETPPPSPTATETPPATFTPAPTRTPRPTPFGGGSRIAFSSNRDGNYEIYIMDSDGSNQTRLTNSPSTEDWFPESLPESFPNGEWLLYFSYSEGPPIISRLSWITTDGSEQWVLGDGLGGYSSLSLTGSVALMIYTEDGGADIGVARVDGSNFVRLTDDPGKDMDPCWSPDGRMIAFVSDRDGPNHIYLMNRDGSNQHRLTDSFLVNEGEPAWSPDGSTIAFSIVDETDTSNIYLINPDGTNFRPLTEEVGSYNENPVWSPDGTMVAFWSNRTGNRDIFAINVDGSGLINNLTNHPGDDENPSWFK